jgi:hypothetical protein
VPVVSLPPPGYPPRELAEAIGVTLLLEGGPATDWWAGDWEAYEQFREDAPDDPTAS